MAKWLSMARKPRERREIWEQRIHRLRASALTDQAFAADAGVNLHTLRKWKWLLGREDREGREGAKKKRAVVGTAKRSPATRSRATRQPPTFAQLQVATNAEPVTERIELCVCGVTVRVPASFDEATLLRVLSTLRRAS